MKVLIASWMAFAGTLFAGGLKFAETSRELTLGPTEKSVSTDFKFTNDTNKDVTIVKTDGGCSCVAVKVAGGKTVYAPGESGVLRTIFDVGNFEGELDRPVKIWIKGDDVDVTTQTLDIRFKIPVLVSLEPKTLIWTVGDEAQPKIMKIKMHGEKPIHIESLELLSEDFTSELTTIKDGEEYEVSVTPKSTERMGTLGVFHIKTDAEVERYRMMQTFAVIQKKP